MRDHPQRTKSGRKQMIATRRMLLLGAPAAAGFAATARADDRGTIRIGWVQALTGANASAGIGFDRGVRFRVDEINATPGGKWKIELIRRDTQGDPTKAVNAVQELISSQHVHCIVGPSNSGETLAVTPIIARAGLPHIHAGTVDSLIDPVKFPNAFRLGSALWQWMVASGRFLVDIRHMKTIAVLGDSSGYGAMSAQGSEHDLARRGCTVSYHNLIDLNETNVMPDMVRARDAGSQAVIAWTTSIGLNARLLNARGTLGWDVPIVGHPSLGAGEMAGLLAKPEYWQNVYQIGFRNLSYGADGKLGPKQAAYVKRLAAGKVDISDTVLHYLGWGNDVVDVVVDAVTATGSTAPKAIIDHWNTLKAWPGVDGDYTFTPTNHDGYPSDELVMSVANSFHDATYTIAPGY
jgi:branched-chain amino acid transport system substrate-binding protein